MLSRYVSDLMLFVFSLCRSQQQLTFEYVLTKMFIHSYTPATYLISNNSYKKGNQTGDVYFDGLCHLKVKCNSIRPYRSLRRSATPARAQAS